VSFKECMQSLLQSIVTDNYAAALMGGKGRVLAFDRDAKRLARLKANAKAAAASNIEAQLADFLSLPLATDDKFRYSHIPKKLLSTLKYGLILCQLFLFCHKKEWVIWRHFVHFQKVLAQRVGAESAAAGAGT